MHLLNYLNGLNPKNMTFKEFELNIYKTILPNKLSNYRMGQALMLYLKHIWQKEYERLSSLDYYDRTDIDCYYNDNLITKTLKHLKKEWKNYPN